MVRFARGSLTIALFALAVVPVAGSATAEEPISPALEAQLQAPIRAKIKELFEQKDTFGANYIHGSFYDSYKKIDDSHYQVAFIKRTSGPEELVVERYTLTLERGPGSTDTWKIANEELEHRAEGLVFRSPLGDDTFHKFDSFSFEREGLKLTGGPGDLFIDYWRGKPARLSILPSNLRYEYLPPVELGWYQQVLKRQLEKYPKDMVFEAEEVSIFCDAVSCEQLMQSSFQGLRASSIDQLDPKLRQDFDEFSTKLKKSREEDPLSGFRLAMRPEIRKWVVSVRRLGSKDHWASLDYDNERRNEVEFTVTELGGQQQYGFPLFVYNSKETRESGIDPYEIEQREDVYDDSTGRYTLDYDMISLKGSAEMAVRDPEDMTCDFTYKVKAKRDFDYLPFLVLGAKRRPGDEKPAKRPSLDVSVMEDGEGNALTFLRSRGGGLIVFPQTIKAGQEVELHVKFDNHDSIYVHNHTYSRVNREGWAPLISFSDKIDHFDMTISVPEQYQVIGVDHKVSETTANGVRTVRCQSDYPLTFPTVIFGDYTSATSKVKATKADGTPIPVTVYVDKTAMMAWVRPMVSEGTTVEDVIHELQAQEASGMWDIRYEALQPLADQAANAINLYREIYGTDYPFEKMDLVNDPVRGNYGQAPPSIVYLGFTIFWPVAKMNIASRGDISSFQNTVVAHELGHQWWGSTVVNKNDGNYWFVESLAEYSSALFRENLAASQEKDPVKGAKKGWQEYLKNVEEWRRVMLNHQDMFTSVQHSGSMFPGGDPATGYAAIYNKGPYSFHMLRLMFGDEKFMGFLKQLAQQMQRKEIVTRDIQQVAEKALCGVDPEGQPCAYDLEWFFDQWIRGVGMPEYSFNYKYRQAEDGTWIVEGKVKQRVVMGAEKRPIPGQFFKGKINVTVVDKAKKEYSVPLGVTGEETPFAFKVPGEPLDIVLNKNGEMLAHDVLVNRSW